MQKLKKKTKVRWTVGCQQLRNTHLKANAIYHKISYKAKRYLFFRLDMYSHLSALCETRVNILSIKFLTTNGQKQYALFTSWMSGTLVKWKEKFISAVPRIISNRKKLKLLFICVSESIWALLIMLSCNYCNILFFNNSLLCQTSLSFV